MFLNSPLGWEEPTGEGELKPKSPIPGPNCPVTLDDMKNVDQHVQRLRKAKELAADIRDKRVEIEKAKEIIENSEDFIRDCQTSPDYFDPDEIVGLEEFVQRIKVGLKEIQGEKQKPFEECKKEESKKEVECLICMICPEEILACTTCTVAFGAALCIG